MPSSEPKCLWAFPLLLFCLSLVLVVMVAGATGSLNIVDGVALLAGACPVPEGRKQGAQLALLEERLRTAAELGFDLAMMGAMPGSASQWNAERHGFRIAYTRIKWCPAARPTPDRDWSALA
jgi:hypothetical protein